MKTNKMRFSLITVLIIFGMYGCVTPSEEKLSAIFKTDFNDYDLCTTYFRTWQAAARSQELKYKIYKVVVAEKERRELDCYIFPELKDKKPYMEERIKLFEEQGGW